MYVDPHAHNLKTHLVGCETYCRGRGPVVPRTGPTGQEPTSPQRGEGAGLALRAAVSRSNVGDRASPRVVHTRQTSFGDFLLLFVLHLARRIASA